MEIKTSARLHISLIDLNGQEGRLDGGIGITLEKPSLTVECLESNENHLIQYEEDINIEKRRIYDSKILDATNKMNEYLKTDMQYMFNIKEIYPSHHGLGLGTQLSLSIAKLISSLNNQDLSVNQLATIIQRGGTSGIGVHSFEKGGLIIDGGHKKTLKKDFLPSSASKVSPPPLLARYDFPKDWNIFLIIPNTSSGASGKNEVNIFQKYSPINIDDVKQISYLTLMKLMPSVIEEDIESFGDAVAKIQSLGFKKIERDLQGHKLNAVLEKIKELGIPCVGMSSFGPTCFGITDNNSKKLIKDLKKITEPEAKILMTKGKNKGYELNR